MEYDWQLPYQNLSVPVHFEQAEKAPELITAHLNRLEQATKVLLFITNTATIEKYVLAAQRQIEANLWTWLVFTKGILKNCKKQIQNIKAFELKKSNGHFFSFVFFAVFIKVIKDVEYRYEN